MKPIKIYSVLISAIMCSSVLSGQTTIQTTAEETTKGDVNGDGVFNISDAVLLQKWLLAMPDTHLKNWEAANFCEDEKLDVFDLCLMKQNLLGQAEQPVSEGKLYNQIGLVDQNVGITAYQGLIPEGWTAQIQSNWGLINPYPVQELVQFVSPDGKAAVSIISPLVYEQSSDLGYGIDISNFITRAPYMKAGNFIDYYVQDNYANTELINDFEITVEQQANIDTFTENYAVNGINTAIMYSPYQITGYGAEGTIARRQFRLGDGCGEFGCAISAYQYSYTKVFLNITETWWMLLPFVAYTAADQEAFDQYYSDYEVITVNGFFTAEFYSAANYVSKQIFNMITEQRTEERIRELAGGYSSSGTSVTNSDMETQERVLQAWDDYIKDEDVYTLGDGSSLRVPTSVDTVAQNGDSLYFGTSGGVPLDYDILTAN